MKGLPFNAEMALAVWEGRKSVTRRPMKDQPNFMAARTKRGPKDIPVQIVGDEFKAIKPPYSPGEVVYMQEPWRCDDLSVAQDIFTQHEGLFYRAGMPQWELEIMPKDWRSPVTMPEWASRLHLKLTVQPERLHDITKEEAVLEGCTNGSPLYALALYDFRDLWDSIYGKTFPWSSNPYIWRYGLEEVWRKGYHICEEATS
jgi:hypothetical protein